jgi:hypothetical protein
LVVILASVGLILLVVVALLLWLALLPKPKKLK